MKNLKKINAIHSLAKNAIPTSYLNGGGEMGELIRAYNWSNTSIGSYDKWPASLQTILRLLLASKQPMMLCWGKDLLQFYNDSFRNILSNDGKHPSALGQKAKDCWVEIWPIVGPLFKQVLTGTAVWSEDQLIPILKNGNIVNVYWTYGYSPIHNDEGNITGLLAICHETTKKVQSQLHVTKQFSDLFEKAPVAICIFRGENYVIEMINEPMAEFWNRTIEAALNKPVFDLLPEVRDQGFKELLDSVYFTGQRFVAQELPVTLFRNEQMEQAYVKFIYEPLREEDGTITGVMAMAHEITEQVLARKKIEESEQKARMVIESAELGLYEINLLTNIVTGDEIFTKLFDYPYNNKELVSLIPQAEIQIRQMSNKNALVSGKLSYQKKVIHKDKTEHWLKFNCRVFYNDLSQPVKLLGVVENITAEKNFEEERKTFISNQVIEGHQLQLFESVISHVNDAVIIFEISGKGYPENKIIYCNKAVSSMTGFTKEEILGKNLQLFNGKPANTIEWKKIGAAIKNRSSCEIEIINYKKNKEAFWNNICISPVADANGGETLWIAIERDITLRKRKDEELTKAIIFTQEKERFLIGAELHDNVNQILAGTLINLGMVQNKIEKDQKDYVGQSINFLRLAITEIRRLSHWLTPVGLDNLSMVESFENLLGNININNQFLIEFNSDIKTKRVITSEIQLNLYRILQEQLTNIIKHSKATVIKVILQVGKNTIGMNIKDNGVGFDSKKYQGGIGLNNIKKRVELFSGKFILTSSEGNGCEICIRMPLQD